MHEVKTSLDFEFDDTMNMLDKSHKILVKTIIIQNKSPQSIQSAVDGSEVLFWCCLLHS